MYLLFFNDVHAYMSARHHWLHTPFIVCVSTGLAEMYDMTNDPWQTVNKIDPNDNVNDLDTSYVDIVKAKFPHL